MIALPPKKVVFLVFVIANIIAMVPFAKAMPDPFATLVIWPYNTPEDSEGPIVTTSPADLIIYNNDASHVLDEVWLMLVINYDAWYNLDSISTNTSLTFLQEHFIEIPGPASPDTKIPPHQSDDGTDPVAPFAYRPEGWPGIEWSDQYNAGSLRDVLGIPAGGSMYYSVGDLDLGVNLPDSEPPGLNKGDPEYFTLAVTSGGDWRVLVLALGHSDDYPDDAILNVHSPYTRSTLTIVSEPGTILLALASVSALGLYITRYKSRKKQTQKF